MILVEKAQYNTSSSPSIFGCLVACLKRTSDEPRLNRTLTGPGLDERLKVFALKIHIF